MLWSRTDPHNATDNSRARRQGYPKAARAHRGRKNCARSFTTTPTTRTCHCVRREYGHLLQDFAGCQAEEGSETCQTARPPGNTARSTLQQGCNLVFGCTAAGRQLPPLIGIRCGNLKPGTYQIIDLLVFDSNFVIVLHNKFDKLLPAIFRDGILNPTCEFLKDELLEGEYTVVFGDGDCEHNEPVAGESFVEDIERLRQILVKAHVNATGKTSLCDLITLFMMIKQPDDALNHLEMAEYEDMLQEMESMLDATFTPFLGNQSGRCT